MAIKKIIILVGILVLLAGCSSKSLVPTSPVEATLVATTSTLDAPVPTPEITAAILPSETYPIAATPITSDITYPIENVYVIPPGETMGPDFAIDQPVKAGALTVTGIGPSGVPIMLIDVNEPGKIYGESTITQEGKFEFKLSEGLPSNHQIAIRLGDTTGTNLNSANFVYNPNYVDRFMLGILFDVVVIDN